jgi:6-hydroxycyclohex-1-ene-1-carbonyl-CoA dehydrogenase
MLEEIVGYALSQPGRPLELHRAGSPRLEAGQVLVEVAGCGLCHTDVTFQTGEVPVRGTLPLILGHEISGTVLEASPPHEELRGRRVLVPAVLPCGECDLCRSGRSNACPRHVMPGNHVHGGFANALVVPGRFLVPLPDDLGDYDLAELSVISDAVTTPLQAVERSGLSQGDVAVVIGIGGIGTYAVQIAAAKGAHVVAMDIDQAKLDRILEYGARHVVNVRDQDIRSVKKSLQSYVKEQGLPAHGWKIFETSGTAPGQELGWALLPTAGTLAVVGFTMSKLNIRLSNLMAFDATAFGNWGCRPELYPEAVRLVLDGKVKLRPFIELHPLEDVNRLFEAYHEGKLTRRPVLRPEGIK